MKNGFLQDGVRVIAFLGCFLIGLAAIPAYSADDLCDTGLRQRLKDELQANLAKSQDLMQNTVTPPASRDQIANTPCVSKELNNITSGFSDYVGGLGDVVQINGQGAGGIMNKFFQSGFESMNEAASFMPSMLNFQSQASSVLGDLLGGLGGSDAFSSDLCGMMIDMVVKYIQCQMPLQLPDMGNLNFSLNDMLPQGCAGEAARDSIYALSNSREFETLSQPLNFSNGLFSGGTAPFRNGN